MINNRVIHPEEILNFWFQGIDDQTPINRGQPPFYLWFKAGRRLDGEITERFADVLTQAVQGQCDHWQENPASLLALIILFDQFSRHIYRDTPQAFAQDPQALSLALAGIHNGIDQSLLCIQRTFFYMPLMHAEDGNIQQLSVDCFKKLLDQIALKYPQHVSYYQYTLSYALEHQDQIKRFGRFPRRNAVLGRISTQEEINFLKGLKS